MMFTTVHQIMSVQVLAMLEKAYHHHRRRLFRPSTPRSSLYVGDLHPHTIDDDLHDQISDFSSCLHGPTLAQIPWLRLLFDFSFLIRFCLLNCDLIEFELG
ncbi:hypothetical protein Hanom_Chr14g01297481 [Helianthus anomalus]